MLNYIPLQYETAGKHVYLYKLCFTLWTRFLAVDGHFCRVLKQAHNDVTLVADELPLGDAGWVEDQHARLTLRAAAHTHAVHPVRAGRVGATRTR